MVRSTPFGITTVLDQETLILGADEPAPFVLLEVVPAYPAVLVCDHAENRIPVRLGQLGVSPLDLETHFAVDIGAGAVTRHMSAALQLPAVLCAYSRLVVDCNRRLDDPTAFALCADDILVPGNQGLTHANRQARADAVYWPYHHAVRAALAALEDQVKAPALIAIHSFTPAWNAVERPWHIGILWDTDPRIPVALMAELGRHPELIVGDNQPYSGKHPHDFTVDYHAEAAGLAHVSIEIRQDLIGHDAGVERWATLLADALRPILADPGLYTHWTA